jgi:hypothetical protein
MGGAKAAIRPVAALPSPRGERIVDPRGETMRALVTPLVERVGLRPSSENLRV